MAKHYVKLNDKNEIVAGYSEEFPIEVPLSELVLINKDGGRHFELNGEVNPSLAELNVYLYIYEKGVVKRKTEKAIQKEHDALKKEEVNAKTNTTH